MKIRNVSLAAVLLASIAFPATAQVERSGDMFRLQLISPMFYSEPGTGTIPPDNGNQPTDPDDPLPPGGNPNDTGNDEDDDLPPGGSTDNPDDDLPPGSGTIDPGASIDVDLPQLAVRGSAPAQIPISISGGTGPYVVAIEDAPELSYDPATGKVTGTLVATGSQYSRTIKVRVTDSLGAVHDETFSIEVHPVLTASVPATTFTVVAGNPLTIAPSADKNYGSVSWSKGSGTWPAGMNVVGSTLTGSPTVANTYSNLRLVAQDGLGTAQTQTFTITVTPAPIQSSVTPAQLTNGTLHLPNLFTPADWISSAPKTVEIPQGITIGSTSTSVAALTSGVNWGGTLTVVNRGTILGAGGLGSSSSVGGAGGPAIEAQANGLILINESTGRIYGGGGGGGKGGSGGRGSHEGSTTSGPYVGGNYYCEHWHAGNGLQRKIVWNGSTVWTNYSGASFPSGRLSDGNSYSCGVEYSRDASTVKYRAAQTRYSLVYANGGSGGSGGNGAGYNRPDGSNGVAGTAGSTNGSASGGKGGTGGKGGAYGMAGSFGITGSSGSGSLSDRTGSGGQNGGAAGASVKNRSYATITNKAGGIILPAP